MLADKAKDDGSKDPDIGTCDAVSMISVHPTID